ESPRGRRRTVSSMEDLLWSVIANDLAETPGERASDEHGRCEQRRVGRRRWTRMAGSRIGTTGPAFEVRLPAPHERPEPLSPGAGRHAVDRAAFQRKPAGAGSRLVRSGLSG